MGAGISKEQERRAKYNSLQSILRQLRKAGVECQYGNKAVFGAGFRVSYGTTLRASNGECFGNLHVEVDDREYWLLEANRGLDRIKAVYGGERGRLGVTELAWLIIQVERAVMKGCRLDKMNDPALKVYLHNADGTRFATIQSGDLERGEIYAYNEMQGDRPMIRIGPGNQYTELLPGMTVRYGDGKIIVERKA